MKIGKSKLAISIVSPLVAAVLLSGCGDNTMSQSEIDKAKTSPPMTEADRAKVAAGMAAGAEAAKKSQQDWAAKNPAELAKINAERAKMGRAPLGQ
jgi:hypothetical protein